MTSAATPIPAHLTVVAWPDPVVEALGFPPDHPYSELVWTSTLGPSAVLAWRQLARMVLASPDGFTLDVAQLAHSLGLGKTGGQAPVCRTLRRLAVFGMASFVDERTYAVRRCIPPLSSSQLRRLNPQLNRLHSALIERHDDDRLARRAQLRRGA
ncbi:MAG: hypothetical protein ACRD2W_23730 [Acidimicrobiales bacterium]